VRELLESLDRFTWSDSLIEENSPIDGESIRSVSSTESVASNQPRDGIESSPSSQKTLPIHNKDDEILKWAKMLRDAVADYKLEQEHLVQLLQTQLVEKEQQIEHLQSTYIMKEQQSILTSPMQISPSLSSSSTTSSTGSLPDHSSRHRMDEKNVHRSPRYYYYSNGSNNGDCEIVFYSSNGTIRERYDHGRFTVWRFGNGDVKTQIIHKHCRNATTTYYYAQSKILQMDSPNSILYLFPDGHVENYDVQDGESKPQQKLPDSASAQEPDFQHEDYA
jgi:hypothetical protein